MAVGWLWVGPGHYQGRKMMAYDLVCKNGALPPPYDDVAATSPGFGIEPFPDICHVAYNGWDQYNLSHLALEDGNFDITYWIPDDRPLLYRTIGFDRENPYVLDPDALVAKRKPARLAIPRSIFHSTPLPLP